jgi:hypothetical protein
MKPRQPQTKNGFHAWMALIVLTLTIANCGAQTNSTGLPKVILDRRSQFDVKSKTARDPFFPDSTRRGAVATASTNTVVPTPVVPMANPEDLLVLKGILGSAGRRLALINQRIFSAGMEAYVQTGAGQVKVKCLEIAEKSVVVTVNDGPKTRELRLQRAP